MNILSRLYYRYRKILKTLRLYLMIAGPGIIVMVADNDAGGITTYTATGAKYGFHLIWFLILLGPIAYYVQEMTVRLGAVTKRGHAEAIFHAFGSFWGWFSLLDLVLTDWLTMITEFIGMTAAMSIFGVPPLVTVIVAWILMGADGSSRPLLDLGEDRAGLLRPQPDLYPGGVSDQSADCIKILHGSLIPHFPPGGFTNELFFLLMANIGTTIAPWMIFFQQSAVVDKGMQEKDIPWGKIDTAVGSVPDRGRGRFLHHRHGDASARRSTSRDAAQAAIEFMGDQQVPRDAAWPSASSMPGCWARSASRWPVRGPSVRCSAGPTP